MSQQSLKNHSRYIPLWHVFTGLAVIGGLAVSTVNFIHDGAHLHSSSALLMLAFLILGSIFWYARWFALRAQDRAIRAEENFRHFILTGKPLDKQLGLGQIIALRFASDEELPSLAKKAVDEKLSSKQIKAAVQNWRADMHRV
jgi:hypothetical protein